MFFFESMTFNIITQQTFIAVPFFIWAEKFFFKFKFDMSCHIHHFNLFFFAVAQCNQPGENGSYLQKKKTIIKNKKIAFKIPSQSSTSHVSLISYIVNARIFVRWELFVEFKVVHLMIRRCMWLSCVVMRVRAQMRRHMRWCMKITHWMWRI